ncbi:hypothetical protein RHGRI_029068 [Rhododendron griersonianum]|uniref:Uncharacterized protein n=1 Tax=Rhododendron griersonianum TaxID=479676 RepID=A0AAV6IHY1_9ERIC|nr:hypothetical protein RHGRI_029068 [Rhododendron griersonianum]
MDTGGSEGTSSDAEDSGDHGCKDNEDGDDIMGSEDHSGDDDDGENHSGDDDSVEDLGGDEDENDSDSDTNGNDGDGDEGNDGNVGDGGNLGVDMVQPEVEEDEEDDDAPDMILRRRTSTVLTVPDISWHPHDAAMALANLNSAEVFANLQDDSNISWDPAGGAAADDDFEVQVVEPPAVNEEAELSNKAFFEYYRLPRESMKDITVGDLGLDRIEEIGLTVQNFDKLGFDIWWAALEEAHAALVIAQNAVAAAEAVVEERRLVYKRLVEEARLGDKLIDVPLCDTDPFMKGIFGA